jgi:hypothetical protein
MVPSSCWTFVVRGLESIRLGRAKASIGLRGIDCSGSALFQEALLLKGLKIVSLKTMAMRRM